MGNIGRAAGLIIALTVGFAIFYLGAVTPAPEPADAPAAVFSAGRAMADIRAMGARPHPTGSAAQIRVRDGLLARMAGLGLAPRVQAARSFAEWGGAVAGADVQNLVGVLPGADRAAPALVLMAHYDSVPASPGAADDAAGVASALEIARAIRARGTPRRDVMLVITDGEEAGLLGARAFFDHDPAAAHVGYVINMEARGGGGRAVMFQTATANGEDIGLYRRTARMPNSNALTVLIYRLMPNDTDFTVALEHGKRGLNYAFIGRQFDYHSPSSTPAALDQGALQHMGAQVLPTAMALAFGPLPGRSPDLVYGNLLGDLVLAYPAAWGWGVLALAVGLMAVGARRASLRRGFAAADVWRGLAASLYVLALAAALLALARRLTGVPFGYTESRAILAQFPLFETMMLAAALSAVLAGAVFAARGASRGPAALLALTAGLAAALAGPFDPVALGAGLAAAVLALAAFGAPARLAGGWCGLMIVALAGAIAAQVFAPTAGAVLAWPLTAAALAGALTANGADRRAAPLALLTLTAALTLAWLGLLFHELLQGMDVPALAALPAWLAALVLWPLATPAPKVRGSLAGAAILMLAAVAMALFIRVHPPWSERRPDVVEPVYVVDPAAGRAWRASLLPHDLVAGTSRLDLPVGYARRPVAVSAAAVAPVAPPRAVLIRGAGGALELTVTPDPGAEGLVLALRSATPTGEVRINGQASRLKVPDHGWARIEWSGAAPVSVSLAHADPTRLRLFVAERLPQWLDAASRPRLTYRQAYWGWGGESLVVAHPALAAPPP